MAVTYTWEFPSYTKIPLYGANPEVPGSGLVDVLQNVHWVLNADDGNNTTTLYGVIELNPPSETEYVSLENITKEQVQNWIETKMDDNFYYYANGSRRMGDVVSLKEILQNQLIALSDANNRPVSGTFNF
jgi:hypothetical protein